MHRQSRREFVQQLALLLISGAISPALVACRRSSINDVARAVDAAATPLVTFTPDSFATLSAVCERLLPRDEDPGALDLGVPAYIDRALSDPLLASVRGLLLRTLPILDKESQRRNGGRPFRDATRSEQQAILEAWQHGADATQHFIDVMLSLTLEGAFGDPKYGGNLGGRGFKLIGFAPDPPFTKMPSMQHGAGMH